MMEQYGRHAQTPAGPHACYTCNRHRPKCEHTCKSPSFDEQALVERLIVTLDPFITATTQVSSETKPTLHYVLPRLLHLQNCLQLPSDTNAERKFKKAMTDNLPMRPFDLPAYKMAFFLHPETKQLRFLTEEQRKFTIDTAMEEVFTLSQGQGLLKIKQESSET